MKYPKMILTLALGLSLSSCIGAVIGVAVDTTAAVIKAPFQLTGAVVGVAADTTGTVIAAPFRMANAAVGGGHHDHDRHHSSHDEGRQHGHQADYEHEQTHPDHPDEAHGEFSDN